jgi:hypothetical protein
MRKRCALNPGLNEQRREEISLLPCREKVGEARMRVRPDVFAPPQYRVRTPSLFRTCVAYFGLIWRVRW